MYYIQQAQVARVDIGSDEKQPSGKHCQRRRLTTACQIASHSFQSEHAHITMHCLPCHRPRRYMYREPGTVKATLAYSPGQGAPCPLATCTRPASNPSCSAHPSSMGAGCRCRGLVLQSTGGTAQQHIAIFSILWPAGYKATSMCIDTSLHDAWNSWQCT